MAVHVHDRSDDDDDSDTTSSCTSTSTTSSSSSSSSSSQTSNSDTTRRHRATHTTTTYVTLLRQHRHAAATASTSHTDHTSSSSSSSAVADDDDDDNDDVNDSDDSTTSASSPTTTTLDARSTYVTARDVDIAVVKHGLREQQLQRYLRVCWSRTHTHDAPGRDNVSSERREWWCARHEAMCRRHMDAMVERFLSAPEYARARVVYAARMPRHEQQLRTAAFATAYDTATYTSAATTTTTTTTKATTTAAATSATYHRTRHGVTQVTTPPQLPMSTTPLATPPHTRYGLSRAEVELLVADAARRLRFLDDTLPWRPLDFYAREVRLEAIAPLDMDGLGAAEMGDGDSYGGDNIDDDDDYADVATATQATDGVDAARRRRAASRPLTLTAAQQQAVASAVTTTTTRTSAAQWHNDVGATTNNNNNNTSRPPTTATTTNMVGGCINRLIEVLLLAEHDTPFAHGVTEVNYTNLFLLLSSLFVMADVLVTKLIRFFRSCLHAFCCVHEQELTLTTLQRLSYFVETTAQTATRDGAGRAPPPSSSSSLLRAPLSRLDDDTRAWPCSVGRYRDACVSPSLRPLDPAVVHALGVLSRYVRRLAHTHYARIDDDGDGACARTYTLLDTCVWRRGVSCIDAELQQMLRQHQMSTTAHHHHHNNNNNSDNDDDEDSTSHMRHAATTTAAAASSWLHHDTSLSSSLSLRPHASPHDAAATRARVGALPRHGSRSSSGGAVVRAALRRSPLRPTLRSFDVPASRLADQLCLLAHRLLSSVAPLELLRRVCDDADVRATVPCHLHRLLDYTAHLQLWTAAVVVTQPSWDDCARALQHMLQLCRLLYDRQNYEMASAVLQGLCHASVHAVERAYAERHDHNNISNSSSSNSSNSMLSAKAMSERHTLQSLLDPFAAYSPSSLNSIVARVAGDMSTPMVPAVAPILAVLREYESTMGKTATVRRFDGQTVVNWSKLVATGTFVSLWLRCQRIAYAIAPDAALQRFVWSIRKHTWTDDMLVQVAQRPKTGVVGGGGGGAS